MVVEGVVLHHEDDHVLDVGEHVGSGRDVGVGKAVRQSQCRGRDDARRPQPDPDVPRPAAAPAIAAPPRRALRPNRLPPPTDGQRSGQFPGLSPSRTNKVVGIRKKEWEWQPFRRFVARWTPLTSGRTYMHEHVFVLDADAQQNYPGRMG